MASPAAGPPPGPGLRAKVHLAVASPAAGPPPGPGLRARRHASPLRAGDPASGAGGRLAALASVAFLLASSWAGPASAAEPRWLGKEPRTPPARIVTLAPSLTEVLLDLGAASRLVGVSRYDDAPEVKALPRIGGFLDPSPEAVLALRPDVVVAQPSPGNKGAVEQIARLGVPVLVLPLHSVPEVLASVRSVGRLLGTVERGEALATRIEAGLADVRARTGALHHPRVLMVYGWQPLVVAGPGTFADAVITAAGGENAAAGAAGQYPVFSAETALAAAPDLVLDASGGHGAGTHLAPLAARTRPAGPALFRPGPRILEAVQELSRLLHPAAFLPGATAPAPKPAPAASPPAAPATAPLPAPKPAPAASPPAAPAAPSSPATGP